MVDLLTENFAHFILGKTHIFKFCTIIKNKKYCNGETKYKFPGSVLDLSGPTLFFWVCTDLCACCSCCIKCREERAFYSPGLVRAPRALLVVERGFALVLVAEVWAAAAAAARVARFCNCKAFMPVERREKLISNMPDFLSCQTRKNRLTKSSGPPARELP
jgi:hypothetical protein